MINKENVKWFWGLLKESYTELKKNDPLRLSSSTAFFASFAIIPIIVLLLDLLGPLFSEKLLKGEILKTLRSMIGENATDYLATILENVQNMQQGPLITLGIIIFLIFVATTLFQIIHNSFNQIWQVKPKENADLIFILRNRVLSLAIILFGSILFLITLLIEIMLGFVGNHIFFLLSEINHALVTALNAIFSLGIFTVWLATVYKYLPDIKLPWKPVWFGSFLTAILFSIGQFIIGKVIISGNLDTIYGASASLVLLLLFIFYSSFILYYGFCLVKKYAEKKRYKTKSEKFAVRYEINELE